MDWNFVFKVQEGEVYRVCPPVNPQFRKRRFHMNKSALDEAEDRFAHLTESEWKKTYCKKLRMFKGRVENLHLGPLRIPHEHHLQRVSWIRLIRVLFMFSITSIQPLYLQYLNR